MNTKPRGFVGTVNTKIRGFVGRWMARFALIPIFLIYLIPLFFTTVFYTTASDVKYERVERTFVAQNPEVDPVTEWTRLDGLGDLYFLYWLGLVIAPLVLTVGVFTLYRNNYQSHAVFIQRLNNESEIAAEDSSPPAADHSEIDQWKRVFMKATDWNRFLLPLCFFNMFVTVVPLVFLGMDFLITEQSPDGEIIYGLGIPANIFFFGFLGFVVYFLEMTRRRYISRNIVPHFYMSSAFRFLYVAVIVPVFYIFLQVFNVADVNDNRFAVVVAFLLGMFPLQFLAPINERVRKQLGMHTNEDLPITLVNGVNSTLESILQEENIDSVQALAMTDASLIHRRTAIPRDVIDEWKSQAQLFHALGDENLVRRFARMSINDIEDLSTLSDVINARGIDADVFMNSFKTAMAQADDAKAVELPEYWDVLSVVLAREYNKTHNIQTVHYIRQSGLSPADDEAVPQAPDIQIESPGVVEPLSEGALYEEQTEAVMDDLSDVMEAFVPDSDDDTDTDGPPPPPTAKG